MPQKWILPPDAVERWRSGESLPTLAKAYGTSIPTLHRALREAGGTPAPPWTLPADAVDRYLAGAILKDLAAEYGTSGQTLGRRLQAAGVTLRGQQKTKTQRERISKAKAPAIDEARLRELAARGMSCREMAAELGFSEGSVWKRMVRLGIPRLPAKARPGHNYFWKGGRTVDKQGYVLLKISGHPHANYQGYVREHRLVMEQQLGRYLEPQEVVDHRDGNTSNNDPSNLRLFATNADHLRETLKGRVPNWTEDGKRRIRAGVLKAAQRRAAIRQASENGGPPSP